jgi:ubiquinol oxidase
MVNKILAPDVRALKEEAAAEPPVHHRAIGFSDRFALGFTKLLRFAADTFFAKRYGHRAIVLETVAAVPGMVGLTALRRMCDDDGWIRTLLEEAENERMHLMTFVQIAQPNLFERLVIIVVQWVFYVGFFLLYLVSKRTAHRVVGYFEEEAVTSYTLYLKEIDEGRSPNVAAPAIAKHYWKLADDATLRDVVLVVRADEAHHRDVNHGFASKLAGKPINHTAAPYPAHADDIRLKMEQSQTSTPYRTTPIFDETSLPGALRREHRTKVGVWGIIRVLEGELVLTFIDPPEERRLTPEQPGFILPDQPHFATPAGPMRMQIEFYDHDPDISTP